MSSWLALLLLAAAVASAATTGAVIRLLRHRAILDHPNERSSHAIPTPRGGGWGILLVLAPAWGWMACVPGTVLLGLAGLAGVSWLDDRRGLPPGPRLLAQAAAVGLGLAALPSAGPVFQGLLPDWADRGLTALCWLWFINLFNFMDGIDGIAGGEAASVAGGIALAAGLAGLDALAEPAALLTGAALGFLVWNWQPAKVFLGDVGSVPLGFALGWLLAGTAAAGLWMAAMLLPLYFAADATWTLLRRLAAGHRPWQAHREHFYQRAVRGGLRHAQVVRAVLIANAGLIGLAVAAPRAGWPVLVAGALVVALLLAHLQKAAHGGGSTP